MAMRWTSCLIIFFIAACVSKTVHDARFSESQAISGPAVSVSLPSPTRFTFAAVGDTHVGGGDTTRLRRILGECQAAGDAFIALLGDIVDEGKHDDVVAVRSAISDFGFTGKFLPIIGNHDVFGDGWVFYKELLGASHYSVDIGNSRFIAIDTADGTVGEAQAEWLEAELAKPKLENTFLLSHYLPVVPGQRTYLKLANEEEAARLMKLASKEGVRAWLGAHYHSYILSEVDGVTYLVAGGAGGRRMEPYKENFYVRVTVDGANVSYEVKPIE